MGVGFMWLYISIAILAVVGAIILWFTTKNIWAVVSIVAAFAVLAGIIVISTVFANKSDSNTAVLLYRSILL